MLYVALRYASRERAIPVRLFDNQLTASGWEIIGMHASRGGAKASMSKLFFNFFC